jgi:AraC-like DNA-binding protein
LVARDFGQKPAARRTTPRVYASDIRRMLDFIERPELAAALGIPREILDDPDATVPIDVWYGFVEAATEASGDPFLGLHYGIASHRRFRENAGAMRLLLLSSDTMRVAVDRVLRYQRYWNEGESYEIEEQRDLLVVRYRPWGPARPAHVQLAEKTVAQTLAFVRVVARGLVPHAACFPHGRRPGDEELSRVLGCQPQFGRDWTEVVLPANVLDARLPTADAVLFRVLDRQLAERIKEVTPESPFADRVCKVIVDYLHRERLSLAAVARIVGCSERTLQRRLTDAGTSFRGLVDEARRSRAVALLECGAAVPELAAVLGYAEETAFYRAFERWMGTTPEIWRSTPPAAPL